MDCLKATLQKIIYGSVLKEAYKDYEKQIAVKNAHMLRRMALAAVILGIVIGIYSIFTDSLNDSTYLYLSLTVVGSAILLLFKFRPTLKSKTLMILFYLVLEYFLCVCIFLGTFMLPATNAVAIFVMMAVLPLFVADMPGKLILLNIFVTIIFIICSFIVKSFEIAIIDCVNAIGFLCADILILSAFTNVHINDIIQKTQIEKQRDTDFLTSLYNRGAAERYITHALSCTDGLCAFMLIDLNSFKKINDTYGHICGDFLLTETGRILVECVGTDGFVARLGGDEFTVFINNIDKREIAEKLAHKLCNALCRDIIMNGKTLKLSASIGLAFTDDVGMNYDRLYHSADMVMYKNKEEHKQQVKNVI